MPLHFQFDLRRGTVFLLNVTLTRPYINFQSLHDHFLGKHVAIAEFNLGDI